jgi:hypothetical protein
MVDVIAPADAFRHFFCTSDREIGSRFADKITSYAWFWYPKSQRIPYPVHAAADRALKRFCKHVREGDIRLRGELLAENPPAEIDRADCIVGELHVFNQTLTIYAQGLRPARVYRRVFCVKDDVLRIVRGTTQNKLGAPLEHDWDDFKQKFLQLWQKKGDFRLPQNQVTGWNSQTAAAKTLLDYIQTRCEEGREPHQKTVEGYIADWVKELDPERN